MLSTRFSASIVAVAIALGACSPSTTESPEAATTVPDTTPTTVPLNAVPTDYAGFLRQPTACSADQPEPAEEMQFEAPADMGIGGPKLVTLTTSCGPIEITLDPSVAPATVNSFVFLAAEGYFDGTVSHRVIPGFMMQAGDPTATGLGGPGYRLPDELPADGATYARGTVAMANAGPGTAGSQFFILFGDASWLPPQYSIFGEVTSGFETLDAIEAVPLGRGPASADPSPSTPLESIFVESVDVSR
jgi:cyclophilin family peptidyl-prolyl cis-trans isomerase